MSKRVRTLFFLAAAILLGGAPAQSFVSAQPGAMAPTYARTRMDGNGGRGGGYGHGNGRGGYGYGYGYNYFPPYYAPVVTGSWYARPYPYHFDYYRYRWGNQTPIGPQPPAADCPCANDAAPVVMEPTEPPAPSPVPSP